MNAFDKYNSVHEKYMTYSDIAERAEKLAALMRNPEPGLICWSEMVAKNAQYLSDWWLGKMAPEEAPKKEDVR